MLTFSRKRKEGTGAATSPPPSSIGRPPLSGRKSHFDQLLASPPASEHFLGDPTDPFFFASPDGKTPKQQSRSEVDIASRPGSSSLSPDKPGVEAAVAAVRVPSPLHKRRQPSGRPEQPAAEDAAAALEVQPAKHARGKCAATSEPSQRQQQQQQQRRLPRRRQNPAEPKPWADSVPAVTAPSPSGEDPLLAGKRTPQSKHRAAKGALRGTVEPAALPPLSKQEHEHAGEMNATEQQQRQQEQPIEVVEAVAGGSKATDEPGLQATRGAERPSSRSRLAAAGGSARRSSSRAIAEASAAAATGTGPDDATPPPGLPAAMTRVLQPGVAAAAAAVAARDAAAATTVMGAQEAGEQQQFVDSAWFALDGLGGGSARAPRQPGHPG